MTGGNASPTGRSHKKMWWRRKRMLKDLDRDIREHLELEVQDNLDRGMSPEDARYAALRTFGNVTRVKEETRGVWISVRLEQLLQDFRLALRSLRRNPGFAFTAVLILALGIAANVIVFGVMDAVVLRSVNLPHPEQVMTLQPKDGVFLSHPEMRDVRDGNTVFSAVAAFRPIDFGLETKGVPRSAWGAVVSGQYFEVMGIKPFLGRVLERADDDHPGASDAAVISWPEWKNNFGADPDVVGTTIRINKHPYTIVGVTPESFQGTEKFGTLAIYVPMTNQASLDSVDWLESRSFHGTFGLVRMKDGVHLSQAQAELETIAARIAREHPKEEDGLALKLSRPGLLGDFFGGPVRAFLGGVMGLAGIVLLAACANLGGLFAARTADRTREIAIRMSIGSSRWRVVRQILVEAVVLALCGGACACLIAWIALDSLAAWQPSAQYPLLIPVTPQPSLVLIGLAISLFAGFVFGVMPLRQIFKTDPNDAIKNGGIQFQAGRRWAFRDVLLAAQIALCCVTVTAAFVSLRGLQKSLTMDLGIKPQGAIRTQFNLSKAGIISDDATDQFQQQLLEKVSQIPGVEAAGYSDVTPLALASSTISVFLPESTDFRPSQKAFPSYYYRISPGYLDAAGTRLLAGRDIRFADTKTTPQVAIVNQEFARRLFHSEEVVGRYFKTGAGVPIEIVGVVVDGKQDSLSEGLKPAVFFPMSQKGATNTVIVVRTHRDTAEMVDGIRRAIRDLDPSIPIERSGPWNSQLAMILFPSRVAAVALGLFGAFGLLLSIAGTFGLASYTVSKRLRELSIRLALGARARAILSVALGRMMVLLGIGSLAGITLGVAASRLLSVIVYQASAQDPLVLAAVAFTAVLTGLVSVAGPVRRVLHVDPAKLLREQ
jgi:predicted permease